MLSRYVRQHLLSWLMVESDLVPLDELPYEEEQESDVFGPGAEHRVSRHAQCSCAVAVDGDREKVLNPSSIRKLERYTASPALQLSA